MVKKRIPQKVKTEILRYVNELKKDDLPISKVILFGSYVKGAQHKWSDIDLCIVSPKFKNSFKALQYLWRKRIIYDIQYTIEPIGFTPKDMNNKYSSLIQEINMTGLEIEV